MTPLTSLRQSLPVRSGVTIARPWGPPQGAIRGSDPISVEVTGPALSADLYRLVATVDIYPAGHSPEEPPLYGKHASGDLMRVADASLGPAPAMA